MSEKLCKSSEFFRGLCPMLGEGMGLNVNQMLRLICQELDPSLLERFKVCADRHCSGELLYQMFSYFKLFKDVDSFKKIINSPDIPPTILEDYIIYLMGFCHEIGESRESFFSEYLQGFEQDTLVRLLKDTRYLYREVDFFVHILTRLDNTHIDHILQESANCRQVLTDILLNFPEERITNVISRNPAIYEHSVHFLEEQGKSDEAKEFVQRYSRIINNAGYLQSIAKRINSWKERNMSRSERTNLLISLLKEMDNPREAFEVLEYKDVFQDVFEVELVRSLLTDPQFSYILSGIKFTNNRIEQVSLT